MDHLATTDVDTAMVGVNADVTRLRVAHARPVHERVGGAQTRVAAGKAVAYQAGAVEGVGATGAPLIGLAHLGISTVYHGVARYRLLLVVVGIAAGIAAAIRAGTRVAAAIAA